MVRTPSDKDRRRRSAPKTKTGCLTCKIRRVKCGEEKPECYRCLRFGMQCDGYLPLADDLKRTGSNRNILPHTKHSPLSPNMLVPISVARVGGERGQRYFDLFCGHTSFEIMPSHDSFSTRHMLLQAAYSDPSLKHAIIALGALDKTAETMEEFSKLSLDNPPEVVSVNEHHRFALEEYTKAVADMRVGNTMKDIRTTLLSILLIFCFEAWNGNIEVAARQVRNGVRIIQEWRSTIKDADKTPEAMSPAPHILDHDLILIFGRLVTQLAHFCDPQLPALVPLIAHQNRNGNYNRKFLDTMPKYFKTIEESLHYHQGLFRHTTIYFSTFLSRPPPALSAFPAELASQLLSEQQYTIAKSLQWLSAFEPTYKAFLKGFSVCESRQVRVTKAQLILTYIMISAFFKGQEVYDTFNDRFAEICTLLEEALALQPVVGKLRPTNYSLAGRVVSTLWMPGIRCRDRVIRRKCISLLLKYPRREGVFDSLFCAKMIEFVMELEEQYLEGDYVPAWARISAIRWESDLEKRTAALSCEQRVSSCSDEVVTKMTTITW